MGMHVPLLQQMMLMEQMLATDNAVLLALAHDNKNFETRRPRVRQFATLFDAKAESTWTNIVSFAGEKDARFLMIESANAC